MACDTCLSLMGRLKRQADAKHSPCDLSTKRANSKLCFRRKRMWQFLLKFLNKCHKGNSNSFTDASLGSAGALRVRAVPCQKKALNCNRYFIKRHQGSLRLQILAALSNSLGSFWSVNSKFLTKKTAPLLCVGFACLSV
jgi:hypothetical protein